MYGGHLVLDILHAVDHGGAEQATTVAGAVMDNERDVWRCLFVWVQERAGISGDTLYLDHVHRPGAFPVRCGLFTPLRAMSRSNELDKLPPKSWTLLVQRW